MAMIFLGCNNSNTNPGLNLNPGTNNSTNADDAKASIATVEAYLNFYINKKIEILNTLFSDDPETVVFGVGASLWKGKETIIKNLTNGINDIDDSNFSFRDQSIQLSGNIAWFSQLGNWSYDYKGQLVDLQGIRI